MLQNVLYKEAEPKDVDSIFLLIRDSFDKFVAVEYEEEGIQEFYKHINPANLFMRIKEGYYTCIATYNDRIIGVIQLRELLHISILFVDKEYQGKGVGRALFQNALKEYTNKNHEHKVITVNSSPIAVKFYEKLGFRKTKFEQNINGIRHTPLEYKI